MQRFLQRYGITILLAVLSCLSVEAQEIPDTSNPTSVDPKLLEWRNARNAKEYTIGGVNITGIQYLDTSIVYSIANIQPGDKFVHPGAEVFGKAITSLWRQKLLPTYKSLSPGLKTIKSGSRSVCRNARAWVTINFTG